MIAISDEKIQRLREELNRDRPDRPDKRPIFHPFVLECAESAPLSWYLTARDQRLLKKALELKENQDQLGQIARLIHQ